MPHDHQHITSDRYYPAELLILGSTYPSYSRKHIETTCTGALLADGRMARIFPIPRRYLDEANRFKAFQWVTAKIIKDPKDHRPESYRVDHTSIMPSNVIPTTKAGHAERRRQLERSPHMCASVEHLHERHKAEGISLGIVMPREIVDCTIVPKTIAERDAWIREGHALLSQIEMFEKPLKPLDFPEVEFVVSFLCDDARCTRPHEMKLHTWGIHELWRKLEHDRAREEKVVQSMWQRLNLAKNDVFFFMGNLRNVQCNFCLMDSYSCPKSAVAAPEQPLLFAP